MKYICQPSSLHGIVEIPASKSHTIRAVAIAAMASGESTIESPLMSGDTLSALKAAEALGAGVESGTAKWHIKGCAGQPVVRQEVVDIGNSGTTLRIMMGMACLLQEGKLHFIGDEQVQRRPAGPLLNALNQLGGNVVSVKGNGCAPFVVGGSLRGGHCTINAPTSQYVTSLLMATPLAPMDTVIDVLELNEKPYVQLTLDWLRHQNIRVEHDEMRQFRIRGRQGYNGFRRRIPADFSSATFFLAAGALPGNQVSCRGLDMHDSQADKRVIDYLEAFGAAVTVDKDLISVTAKELVGLELDLRETPDALPMMAVLGCFAEGETRLRNVAHARLKETDRIAVMCAELAKLGAHIEELPDGLVIRSSKLKGNNVSGHSDHRVVMALTIAGMACTGKMEVTTAEAVDVTFPSFLAQLTAVGGAVSVA